MIESHNAQRIPDKDACYLHAATGYVKSPVNQGSTRSPGLLQNPFPATALDALAAHVSAEREIVDLQKPAPALPGEPGTVDGTDLQLREESRTALRRVTELETRLQEALAVTNRFKAGLKLYQAEFDRVIAIYRSQRAWQVMIALRKAYDLWTRRGWTGKLRSLPLLLRAPLSHRADGDQEIQFPSIRNFVPHFADDPDPASRGEAINDLEAGRRLPRKYDIVVLAIIDFDFRFQRPQQLAVQFAKNGHRVFWISPTRFIPPGSGTHYHVLELRNNIWEVQLSGPQLDVYLGEIDMEATASLAGGLRRLSRDFGISESAVLVQLPFWRRLGVALREESAGILVYDCMDEWDSFENIGEFNRRQEAALVRECDVLTVTAQRLADKFAGQGLAPVLVRNAVDYDFFAGAKHSDLLPGVSGPIVGYFGAIADWIDLDLVYAVAKARPQYSFVLVGQVFGRDMSALEALPNLHLLGNQPYERIPGFLRLFDACIIPFLINDVTTATDPVKLYEYLSLGKPVVATDMAELHQCQDVVYLAKTPEEFVRYLDAALAEDGEDLRNRRIEFARRNTWISRVESMESAISSKFPLMSIAIVTHNSERYIGSCLDSILQNDSYPNTEIIVVDNASTDRTPDVLRSFASNHPRLHYDLLPENRGFAAGNNLAVESASGEDIVFLNPDTIVTPGWLGRLRSHLRRDPSLGLVCAVTNFAGNWAKIPFSYHDERSMELFSAKLAAECRGDRTEVRMAPLFCAMMSRQLFLDLGGLDERYGIGMFEDDDLSAAVRAYGLRVCVAEDCFVHHFGQGAFGKLPERHYGDLFDRNRRRFENKWRTKWSPHRLRPGAKPPLEEVRFDPEDFCRPQRHTDR